MYKVLLRYKKTKKSVYIDNFVNYTDAEDEMIRVKGHYRPSNFDVSYILSKDESLDMLPALQNIDNKAISLNLYIQTELQSFFEESVKKHGFESARESFIANSSDEFYTGPDIVCSSFAEYAEMVDVVVTNFLKITK